MELIGIDYGHKRMGLSHGDTQLGLAFALPALTQQTHAQRLEALAAVIASYRPERLIVGYPYHMDGRVSEKAREVDVFVEQLQKRFQLPVERVDERLTSMQAQVDLQAKRKKPRSLKEAKAQRESGEVDSQAARLILQDYMDAGVA